MLRGTLPLVAALVVGHTPAWATPLKVDLVEALEPCVVPNATTSPAFPVPGAGACAPPVRADALCGFEASGSGRVLIRVSRRGVVVSVKLADLDPGCEGQSLALRVGARARAEACTPSPCVVNDADSGALFPARPCVVRNGRCAMGGTLPAADLPGSPIEIGLVDVAVTRGGVRSFVAGFRLPAGKR